MVRGAMVRVTARAGDGLEVGLRVAGRALPIARYGSRRNRQVCMVVWIAADIRPWGYGIAPYASQHGCRRISTVELARGHDRRDRGCHCLRRGLSAEHHAAPFDHDGDWARGRRLQRDRQTV